MDGEYGFDGSCKPSASGHKLYSSQQTFSLGVFPWTPKSGAKNGTYKRGKVVTRVIGDASNPERANNLAQRIVDALSTGRILPDSLQKRYDARSTVYDGWLL